MGDNNGDAQDQWHTEENYQYYCSQLGGKDEGQCNDVPDQESKITRCYKRGFLFCNSKWINDKGSAYCKVEGEAIGTVIDENSPSTTESAGVMKGSDSPATAALDASVNTHANTLGTISMGAHTVANTTTARVGTANEASGRDGTSDGDDSDGVSMGMIIGSVVAVLFVGCIIGAAIFTKVRRGADPRDRGTTVHNQAYDQDAAHLTFHDAPDNAEHLHVQGTVLAGAATNVPNPITRVRGAHQLNRAHRLPTHPLHSCVWCLYVGGWGLLGPCVLR